VVPALVADASEHAARRFLEFFAATIRNKNTRLAYYRAVVRFFTWCERHQLTELVAIEPLHVAAYIEELQRSFEKPSVKQHLAALRMLFDWLVTGGVLATNPAHAVRGPKHVVKTGKTPVLTGEQARTLLDSIDTSTVVGLRDRALISIMTFAFARIGAVVSMRVEDYYPQGKRWWVRLHEKGGKRHEMPAHHTLEAYLDAYIDAAGMRDSGKSPLFRSAAGRTGMLTEHAMNRIDAYRMIRRRAADAGFKVRINCHTFRPPGSRPIWKPAERWKMRRPWRRMKARAPPSSTTVPVIRSRLMKSSGLRFDSGENSEFAKLLGARALLRR
jgi:site-specific recombinase XerD